MSSRLRRWLLTRLASLVCAISFPALLGCAAEETRPRLVLVVATCTVNTSYLGPYAPHIATTPFLDRLAEESLVFDRHYTEAGQSGVAYASIFSGGQADRHGIFYHPSRADDELVWLPEVFSEAGYETYSWLAHSNASARLNYAQGVAPERQRDYLATYNGRELNELLEEMQLHPDRKVMVLSNFTLTHRPYGGERSVAAFCKAFPEECAGKIDEQFWEDRRMLNEFPRQFSFDTENAMELAGLRPEELDRFEGNIELLYRAAVYRLDQAMRRIVSAIERRGLLEESLIVFTADHGEAMHRKAAFPWTHGFQLTPGVLHVPLLIYGPSYGVSPGRYPGVSRSIDVLPTVAGLSGIEAVGENITGIDLAGAIRGVAVPPSLQAMSHTSLWADAVWDEYSGYDRFHSRFPIRDPALMWVSAVSDDMFYRLHQDSVGDWHPEVFDLASDPRAERGSQEDSDPVSRAMFGELRSYRERLLEAAKSAAGGNPLERFEEEEALRALGYIE